MEVVDNATQLKAQLIEQEADSARPGWTRVTLKVMDSTPVPNLPSLLPAAVGDTVQVLVPPADRDRLEALLPDGQVAVQVRLRAPGVHTAVPGSIRED